MSALPSLLVIGMLTFATVASCTRSGRSLSEKLQAALDERLRRCDAKGVSVAVDIPHGGWCPRGREAEDGVIGDRYDLKEAPSDDYAQRTEWNVRDSDATVIFTTGPTLARGAKATADFTTRHEKPWLHLACARDDDHARLLREFLTLHKVGVLDVAGSRASKEPEVVAFVGEMLKRVLLKRFPPPCPRLPGLYRCPPRSLR